jgi:hypothetical protein
LIRIIINKVLKNKRDVIASDQRERSNLVFASERPDCLVASLLAMTKSDFFSSLLKVRVFRFQAFPGKEAGHYPAVPAGAKPRRRVLPP